MESRRDCRLRVVVETWSDVRATSARLEKRARMRALFAGLKAEDLRLAASYLAGEIPQGSLQIGWSVFVEAERETPRSGPLPLFATEPEDVSEAGPSRKAESGAGGHAPPWSSPGESPTLRELDESFTAIQQLRGSGATKQRQKLLRQVLEPLTAEERAFLRGLILGELRQGALRTVVLDAVAEAFATESETLRRAVMFAGSLGEVLQTVAREGADGLARLGPRPGVPVEPMLAAQAADLEAALTGCEAGILVEWKLDGVRVQLHKAGNHIQVFSRQLRDVTAQAPEAVQLARGLAARSIILDGELIALDAHERPVAFQDLMSRFSREKERQPRVGRGSGDLFGGMMKPTPAMEPPGAIVRVLPVFFDVLEWNGESQVERAQSERRTLLSRLLPREHRVPGEVVHDAVAARHIYEAALAAGHEGVVLKNLEAPYTAGRRGSAWRKLKPAVTLDLVILAAEWGHGRRQGFLSNLHLGARDASDPGKFHMLGKTFKGLTDEMLRVQTQDLLTLETKREGHIVYVRPERVVEIAFDGVQRSRRYASGYALRFARVKYLRPDKSAADASTLDEVQALHGARQ